MTTTEPSDETLMAFADGELDDERAETVGAAAARDPRIADRIAMFRTSKTVLTRAFAPVMSEPIPLELYEATLGLPPGGSEAAHRTALRRARGDIGVRSLLSRLGVWGTVAAAVMAVVAGLAAAQWMASRAREPEADFSLASAVAAIPASLTAELSHRPSGERAELSLPSGAAEIFPLASYLDRGALCRDFEITPLGRDAAPSLRAVACAGKAGWQLRALVESASRRPVDGAYQPATSDIDLGPLLGLGAPLSSTQERALLDSLAAQTDGAR